MVRVGVMMFLWMVLIVFFLGGDGGIGMRE